jgi:DNA invertase Pin-like site-specific DNA recombinase
MKIGYARVSTPEQSLALQRDALWRAGCQKVYEEVISGARVARPVLQAMLTYLRAGDVLLIWKLDRLGRSLRHLIDVVTDLEQRGIGFKSLQENLDTTTSSGKLVFHMFGALAEFERELIRERTQAGLVAARARGRLGGRPRGLSTQAEVTALAAETLYREGQLSVRQIATQLNIAKSTLYVYLRYRGVPIGPYTTPALDTAGATAQGVGAGGARDHRGPGHAARPRRPREARPTLSSQRGRRGEAAV